MEKEATRNLPCRGGSSDAHLDRKDVHISRRVVACFPDDNHGRFQDALFDNVDGLLEFFGYNY